MSAAGLDRLFRPRSVAIIGASSDPNKIGGRPLHFLQRAGFAGRIYPVNPASAMVQGLPAFASLEAIGEPVDQVIVALPAPAVLGAVEAAVRQGVGAIQIFTAGFAELGEAGRDAQEAIRACAVAGGVRLLGPNSLGLFSVPERFFGTFATALDGAWPKPGPVAMATQSGAFGSYTFGIAQGRGIGFSRFVATGNEADVDVADCIAWLANDEQTKVILATFEGCKDGARLRAALETARRAGKPVIVMKAGASEQGAAAAASHTGSLAGSDAIYGAVFREAGAHRAETIEEMVDIAYACCGVLPAGDRIGVVTTSGGVGVLLADAVAKHGMRLPEMPASVQDEVKRMLPFASGRNPVDTSAQLMTDLSIFARMLDLMLRDAGLDVVIGFLAHVGRNPGHWAQLRGPLMAVRAAHPDKVFVLCMLEAAGLREEVEAGGFLLFEEPARAVAAIAAARQLHAALTRDPASAPAPLPPTKLARGSALDEQASKTVLAAAGISVLPERLVHAAAEAADAAAALGFPVVMKIVSPDILHKSEIGGVLLGVSDRAEAEAGFRTLMERAAAVPGARIEGVLVAPMVRGGVECILGAQRDPVFGPVIMFGLGGIFVELFRDVTFRPAPFGPDTARDMIAEIKGAAVLHGARGNSPVDVDTIASALSTLARFADANRDAVLSIDINPFIALPDGGYAVDAVIVTAPNETGGDR